MFYLCHADNECSPYLPVCFALALEKRSCLNQLITQLVSIHSMDFAYALSTIAIKSSRLWNLVYRPLPISFDGTISTSKQYNRQQLVDGHRLRVPLSKSKYLCRFKYDIGPTNHTHREGHQQLIQRSNILVWFNYRDFIQCNIFILWSKVNVRN